MCATYQVSIFIFNEILTRDIFYGKGTFIGFFKFSSFARLYLEVLVTMTPQLNLKTECIDSLLCYFSFCFLYSSVFFLKKVTLYLSHAINPYLHGKLINLPEKNTIVFFDPPKKKCM